jgi:hypothetical protein
VRGRREMLEHLPSCACKDCKSKKKIAKAKAKAAAQRANNPTHADSESDAVDPLDPRMSQGDGPSARTRSSQETNPSREDFLGSQLGSAEQLDPPSQAAKARHANARASASGGSGGSHPGKLKPKRPRSGSAVDLTRDSDSQRGKLSPVLEHGRSSKSRRVSFDDEHKSARSGSGDKVSEPSDGEDKSLIYKISTCVVDDDAKKIKGESFFPEITSNALTEYVTPFHIYRDSEAMHRKGWRQS